MVTDFPSSPIRTHHSLLSREEPIRFIVLLFFFLALQEFLFLMKGLRESRPALAVVIDYLL